MKFPNAAKGVKKIFNAEIISLIAALIGGAGLVLGLIGASKETGESAGTITLTVSGVLLIVSGIAILVAGVINIIGFIQAAKDEEGIKRAVLCTLFSALFAFVAAFFENQTGFLGGLGSVLSTIATVLNMLVALFMIGGLMNLFGPQYIDSLRRIYILFRRRRYQLAVRSFGAVYRIHLCSRADLSRKSEEDAGRKLIVL